MFISLQTFMMLVETDDLDALICYWGNDTIAPDSVFVRDGNGYAVL